MSGLGKIGFPKRVVPVPPDRRQDHGLRKAPERFPRAQVQIEVHVNIRRSDHSRFDDQNVGPLSRHVFRHIFRLCSIDDNGTTFQVIGGEQDVWVIGRSDHDIGLRNLVESGHALDACGLVTQLSDERLQFIPFDVDDQERADNPSKHPGAGRPDRSSTSNDGHHGVGEAEIGSGCGMKYVLDGDGGRLGIARGQSEMDFFSQFLPVSSDDRGERP